MPKYLKYSSKLILPLLLLSLFIKTVVFSVLIQPFEFPDEQAHFSSVNFFANEKRMPKGHELDLSNEIKSTEVYLGTYRDKYGNNFYTYHPDRRLAYTNYQSGLYEKNIKDLNTHPNKTTYLGQEAARYPFLYYLYSSIFYDLSYEANVLTRIYVIRLANSLFFLGTIIVAYLIGKEIFKNKKHARLLASLIGLQPMFTFLGAGVNSDNLHIFLFSAILLFCTKLISNGWGKYLSFLLAIFISLDIMTKPQAYIAVPIIVIAVVLRFSKDKMPKLYLLELSKVIIFSLIFSGWYFVPQLVESGGIIGISPHGNMSTLSFFEFVKFSINKFYSQNIVWYWGVFKWLGVVLPKPFWWISNRLFALSIIGILVYFIKTIGRSKDLVTNPSVVIFLLTSVIIYVISIFWYDWQFTKAFGYSFGVQARYYFPTLVIQLAILQIGILSFISKKFEYLKKIISFALVVWFIILNIVGLITILSSYYNSENIKVFINEVSQYKPTFAKGEWVIFWILLYLVALIIILISNTYLIFRQKDK